MKGKRLFLMPLYKIYANWIVLRLLIPKQMKEKIQKKFKEQKDIIIT